MDYHWHYGSPLGGMTMASDGRSLAALWFDRHRPFDDASDKQQEIRQLPVFEETCSWLDVYFSGREPAFTPPLSLCGTPFRLAGQRAAQQGLASQASLRISAQAVGVAVGHNPIAIIVPCHRVIGADGSLTGYAAGLDRKRRLLELEQIIK